MEFFEDIFKRATVRGITDYLLYGIKPDEDCQDYEMRLEESYKRFELAVLEKHKYSNSELLNLANEMTSDTASVYMEIGFQTGILLWKDMIQNIVRNEEKPDNQNLHDFLMKDIKEALLYLHNSEDRSIKMAVDILKSVQNKIERM